MYSILRTITQFARLSVYKMGGPAEAAISGGEGGGDSTQRENK